jgi:hypothetical protein
MVSVASSRNPARYEAEHGAFPDLVRAHYRLANDDLEG